MRPPITYNFLVTKLLEISYRRLQRVIRRPPFYDEDPAGSWIVDSEKRVSTANSNRKSQLRKEMPIPATRAMSAPGTAADATAPSFLFRDVRQRCFRGRFLLDNVSGSFLLQAKDKVASYRSRPQYPILGGNLPIFHHQQNWRYQRMFNSLIVERCSPACS